MAIVCWAACKSHPIIRISASFVPSAVGLDTHSLRGASRGRRCYDISFIYLSRRRPCLLERHYRQFSDVSAGHFPLARTRQPLTGTEFLTCILQALVQNAELLSSVEVHRDRSRFSLRLAG